MPVIGYLAAGSSKGDEQIAAALLKGLAETGYEDGKNIRIEYRWADNQYERLPSMAADLVRQKEAFQKNYERLRAERLAREAAKPKEK